MNKQIGIGRHILKATPRAHEKLKEIVNGSREKINEFIEDVSENGIKSEKYGLFLENIGGKFYYHRCKNIYVIFVMIKEEITIVDLLTETEFKEIKGNN